MWIKKLPGIVANAAVLILDIFVILMIAALFLHQQTAGERVKETITRFPTLPRRSLMKKQPHDHQNRKHIQNQYRHIYCNARYLFDPHRLPSFLSPL